MDAVSLDGARAAGSLAELERIIERGFAAFVQVGDALARIRDERLYADTHRTFETYCRERWGFVASRARQLIAAAETVTAVTVNGLTAPANEAQARELVPLMREDERQAVEVWRELRAEHGERVTAERVREAVGERLRSDRATRGLLSSGTYEWWTPPEYVEAARTVLGAIDLDPASCAEANLTVRARRFYDVETDGLAQPWHGRVWLNPPYAKWSGRFVAKLFDELAADRVAAAVLLLNGYGFDAEWFQPLWDHALCFTDHRIAFRSPYREQTGGSTFGSVIVYLGPEQARFASVFGRFGAVVARFGADTGATA